MGAVTTVSHLRSLLRQGAAGLYGILPGNLESLRGKCVILMYHRVLPMATVHAQCVQHGMFVTPEVFDNQLGFLTRYFQLLSFSELLSLWDKGHWNPSIRYCVITFDDGWLDTYQHAWPLLQRHRVQAVVFLPTDYVGTDRWFWPDLVSLALRDHAQDDARRKAERFARLQQEFPWLISVEKGFEYGDADAVIETFKTRSQQEIDACIARWAESCRRPSPHERVVMNWDEAGHMSAAGIEFGSHSMSHRIMTTLSGAEIKREVTESMTILQQRRLRTTPVFCYPNGTWAAGVAEHVEAAGYRAAVTTQFGYEAPPPHCWFGLKRINIHQDITYNDRLFAYHLAGWNRAHGA